MWVVSVFLKKEEAEKSLINLVLKIDERNETEIQLTEKCFILKDVSLCSSFNLETQDKSRLNQNNKHQTKMLYGIF